MLKSKLAEYLGVALAFIAAMGMVFTVIYKLRYDVVLERNDNLLQQQSVLINTNQKQHQTIADLRNDMAVRDQLMQAWLDSQEDAEKRGERLEKKLEELAKNDAKIAELLRVNLPDGIRGLFQQTYPAGSPDGNSKQDSARGPDSTNQTEYPRSPNGR